MSILFFGAAAFGRFLGVVLLVFFATDGLTALFATFATSAGGKGRDRERGMGKGGGEG